LKRLCQTRLSVTFITLKLFWSYFRNQGQKAKCFNSNKIPLSF
jgi:hypothetical protein